MIEARLFLGWLIHRCN